MKISGNLYRETKLNEPSEEAQALPFYPLLPKDRVGLLKARIYMRERCIHDLEYRDQITQMCAADCAFFIQVFGWFHETRAIREQIGKFPVILYEDQVDIIAWFMAAVGKTDIVLEKTRGIGLSYLLCCVFLWLWLFRGESIDLALVSKDESSLDMPRRPSTLMGKLDLLFENLPYWLQRDASGKTICDRTLKNHKFLNTQNGNVISGYVPTSDKLRSGRFYAIGIDEGAFLDNDDQRFLAATQETTLSRLWISTHNGTATLFYRLTRDTRSDLLRISTFWWNNPYCSAGLYKVVKGRVELLDKAYVWPVNYEHSFEHAGMVRSPWVDRAFRRPGANPTMLFEELYGVAALEHRKLFRADVLAIAESTCQRPLLRGYVDEEGEFEDDLEGKWWLWRSLDTMTGTYAIGADPAIGTAGGAYAGVVAVDMKTGETVLSARLPEMPPVQFARLVVGACKLLAGSRGLGYCKLNYESTGIGVSFANEIARLRYPAVYSADGNKPGVHNRDKGESWLIEFGRAIRDGDVVVRDDRIVDEAANFEYDTAKFKLCYASTDGHGDLALAAAIAWMVAKDRRSAFVRSQKHEYNEDGVGPEFEDRVKERKRHSHLWSSQYRLV